MNSTDDQNQNDVSKQYQEILDKYAQDIKNIASEDGLKPSPTIITPPIPPSFVIDEPLKAISPAKGPGIFKYLFWLSFLIFLGVCGAIAYTVFVNPSNSNSRERFETVPYNTTTPTVPTAITESVCQLNDKTYTVGEGFTAADDCNTCTCSSDLTIACTTMVCTTTPSVSPTSTTFAKDWKNYNNSKYNFSFKYPSDWKMKKEDIQTDFTDIFFQKGSANPLTMRIYSGSNDGHGGATYFGAVRSAQKTFPVGIADEFVFPNGNGYSDIKIPYIAERFINKGIVYVFEFDEITKLTDLENQILSTFKFL